VRLDRIRCNLTDAGRKLRLRASDIVRCVRNATGLRDRQANALIEQVDALRKALESQASG